MIGELQAEGVPEADTEIRPVGLTIRLLRTFRTLISSTGRTVSVVVRGKLEFNSGPQVSGERQMYCTLAVGLTVKLCTCGCNSGEQ